MRYIDIHAHLNFPDFSPDREEVLAKMSELDISAINVGTNLETSREVLSLAEKNDHLWAIVGVHPHEASQDFDFALLKELARQPKVVAIGECGLDFFRSPDEALKKAQYKIFEEQIRLALEVEKPLMLHIRDSYQEVLSVLDHYPEVKTHAHFFAGGKDLARRFLDRGDTISFTGVITFTSDYDEVVRYVPIDRLLAETDCPYVAPAPYRGKRSDPTHVSLVVDRLAEIKGLDPVDLASRIVSTACETFIL